VVDRLLWSSPPPPAVSSPVDDDPSFEFEFADRSLPDVYKLLSSSASDEHDAAAAAAAAADSDAADATDDWVLFTDVSTALSVKTVDALAKLLDTENAVMAVPADRFNERVVPRNVLGRQPVAAAVVDEQQQPPPVVKDDAATESDGRPSSSDAGEQILLVRYDRKLKQLLGVDAYTLS